jgi:hypothetical protein
LLHLREHALDLDDELLGLLARSLELVARAAIDEVVLRGLDHLPDLVLREAARRGDLDRLLLAGLEVRARTDTMPSALISNVTSISTCPAPARGAGPSG